MTGAAYSGTGDDADRAVLGSSREHPEQFAEIYRRHFPGIYRYVAGRLGPDTADDLAAETFLTAFRRRAAFDPDRGLVRAWLFGIATNLVAQHGRAETRRYRALARSAGPAAASHDDEGRIADRLTAAGLRPAQRRAGRARRRRS
jgi:RNA polymerase sigma-70 factor (ECF subfamily)